MKTRYDSVLKSLPPCFMGALMVTVLVCGNGCLTAEQIAMEREWQKKPYDPMWRPPGYPAETGAFGGFGGGIGIGNISLPAGSLNGLGGMGIK